MKRRMDDENGFASFLFIVFFIAAYECFRRERIVILVIMRDRDFGCFALLVPVATMNLYLFEYAQRA
jgi:hypothetical protein